MALPERYRSTVTTLYCDGEMTTLGFNHRTSGIRHYLIKTLQGIEGVQSAHDPLPHHVSQVIASETDGDHLIRTYNSGMFSCEHMS